MKRKHSLAITALLLPLSGFAQEKELNVIFIMADDLGLNDTGYTGSDYYETPNIDQLSKEGMVLSMSVLSVVSSIPESSFLSCLNS